MICRSFANLTTLALLIAAVWPVGARAVSADIGSDDTWDVYGPPDASTSPPGPAPYLGNAQKVCLNCQTSGVTSYGYPFPGWIAALPNVPNATWIWASRSSATGPRITGETSPAQNVKFTFKKDVYLCGPPVDSTIWVAADNSVDVIVNGTTILSTSSIPNHSPGAILSATIPHGIIVRSPQANTIELRVTNGQNPSDCGSDQYKCNPAGVLFGVQLEDSLSALPTCTNPPGNIGEQKPLCTPPQYGKSETCVCFADPLGQTSTTWWTAGTCMSPPAIDGVCGPRNGVATSTAPVTDLCSSGTATPVAGTGPWTWACGGSNGGRSASCSAPLPPPVDGVCGPENGIQTSTAPATGLCSSGTATAVAGTGPWTWTCGGANGGRSASCTALLKPPPPADGACGPANGVQASTAPTTGLCSSGTATAIAGTGPWAWTCGGSNGGRSAGCSALLTGGICRSADTQSAAACPSGQTCGACTGPLPPKSIACAILGIDCPTPMRSAEFYCDCAAYQGLALGAPCNNNNYACASGYCDNGPGTAQTNRCMPRGNTGQRGDLCTADNQCSRDKGLKCLGVIRDGNGNWQPGHCN